MNEELEEAIKRLKNIVDKCKIETKEIGYECDLYDGDEPIPYKEIETVLNYIDNSISKEEYSKIKEELDEYKRQLDLDYVRNNFISKKVIEEKIKELNKLIIETQKELGSGSKEYIIYVYQNAILQELLH